MYSWPLTSTAVRVKAASVRANGARAGVNKERIYRHFGSKEKLFDEVITGALDDLTTQIALPGADPGDYVARLADYYHSHPDLVRLLMWEALNYRDQEGTPPGQEARVERCRRKTASLAEGLGAEPSPAVARTVFMLTGPALFPSMMPQLGRIILGEAADDHEALRDHVAAFVASGLKGSQ